MLSCHSLSEDSVRTKPVLDWTMSPPAQKLEPLSCDDAEGGDTREILIEREGFRIRLADTHHHRSRVSMLIDRMYAWRGYRWELQSGLVHHPNRITLQASTAEQRVIGTLTLGLDGEAGLLADHLYKQEIDAVRAKQRRVCELTRLAVDPIYGSKEILASLFHVAYIFGRLMHRATDVFIEVNPRHVVFYRRMLGFVQEGSEKTCERVGAPAVLLRLELSHVDREIARYAGRGAGSARSLYPYFFNRSEEEGIARRVFADSRELAEYRRALGKAA